MTVRLLWSGLLSGLLLFAVRLDAETGTSPPIEFFPGERLFPKLLADGIAEQFSLNKDMMSRRFIGSIGGSQRIVQLTTDQFAIQAGIGATVYASLVRKPSILEVVTVDFFVDFPLDIKFSDRIAVRTGWGHNSAHLADDGIVVVGLSPINYAKDYIPLLGMYMLPLAGGFAYGGVRFDYFSLPERGMHYILQCGTEFGNIVLLPGFRVYGAIDIKLKSEAAWGSTQSYQLGVKMLERGASTVRFSYTYRTGIEDRGQFYKENTTTSMLGVYFDF